ncbi:MAG: ABC transporter ATP-binding protein [Metamycoplasmataceae bacterium]
MIKRKDNDELRVDIENLQSKAVKNFLSNSVYLEGKKEEAKIIKTPLKGNKKVLIEITNLKKDFGKMKNLKTVLHDVSFKIREGESIGILGANGAGKTTLVEILAGLNKQTSGDVKYLFDYDKSYLEEVGIQFQDSSYPPGLSVKEIISFIIEIYGAKIEKNELNALIQIFGINEFYRKNASSLSGGQQQRLNALLALIHKPKVLFLDELSTGLDITIRTKIKDFIKLYALENNMTIVLISHDMDEVEHLVDRIIIIDKGVIMVDMDKEEILDKHEKLTDFITPYINH